VTTAGMATRSAHLRPISGPRPGLICGENSNPLAVFALIAEGTRIHVMSWPESFPDQRRSSANGSPSTRRPSRK